MSVHPVRRCVTRGLRYNGGMADGRLRHLLIVVTSLTIWRSIDLIGTG